MTSRLVQMQARFQQKQIQEREEKLLRMYENQQQKAYERVGGRSSAGSSTSLNGVGSGQGGGGRGKVRQMFDERRQKAGVDRSYPLEPLKTTKSTTITTVNRGGSVDRNRAIMKTTQKTTIKQQSRTIRTINDDSFNNNNRQQRDIVEMMNDHNLNDFNLDNEQMPNGFNDNIDDGNDDDNSHDVNDNGLVGKLANVGGKLPSEKVVAVVEKQPLPQQKKNRNDFGKTFRKDTKPVIKKSTTITTVRPASGTMQRTKVISNPTTVNQTKPKTSRGSSASSSASTVSRKQQSKQPVSNNDDLRQCKYCDRRFASNRLSTHENICMKTSNKKRKVYDATKKRIEGTEMEQFVTKKPTKNNRIKPQQQQEQQQAPKNDWRRTHEEFINAIRAAKATQEHLAKGGKLSDLPPPPPSTNPDYVQCPHCSRRFNEAAAERHIPKCATFQFNKPKPKASSSKKW